jgi:glutathione S-transferase
VIRVYGSRISYYAGKVEAYLRYRSLEYEMLPMTDHAREIRAGAGAVQSPVLRLEDERWLSDSTPILAWLDAQQTAASIYPDDPGMRFVALLLEDHADEWLWRPAMYYRWHFPLSRDYASRILTDELLTHIRGPHLLKRWRIARRQRVGFVHKDGITDAATRAHAERTTLDAFAQLERVLAERPFLLGDRPSIADFGFMGPMFRHYGQDPTPQELMRNHAPRVYTWVARMWEARAQPDSAALLTEVDEPIAAILREASETHLVQLRENARAFGASATHFEMEVQGCRYRHLPVSRYRVWCLEELHRHWQVLDEPTRGSLRPHLDASACELLDAPEPIACSDYDPERKAPFNRAINVFGNGVPR